MNNQFIQYRNSIKQQFEDVKFQFNHLKKSSFLNKNEKEKLEKVIESLNELLTEYNKPK